MGKIKIRTLGTEQESEDKKSQKQKREEKKLAKVQGSGADERSEGARLLDKRGRQRVPVVEPSEEELSKLEPEPAEKPADEPKKEKKTKFQKEKRTRSKKYLEKVSLVDKNRKYPLNEAVELLEQMQSPAAAGSRSGREKTFDETVELHLNAKDPKISAETTLPHGTGKSLRVAIASDELIVQVEKGVVSFDILLAEPSMMGSLAKVAKVLGPKGLMPNPKNGTITNNPQETAKKYEGGLTFIKTESKAPIIHVAVGKVSFGPKKLEENINAVIEAVKKENILNAVLKSTMSPAIKLQI